jgi:hypothetical protein
MVVAVLNPPPAASGPWTPGTLSSTERMAAASLGEMGCSARPPGEHVAVPDGHLVRRVLLLLRHRLEVLHVLPPRLSLRLVLSRDY